MQPNPSDLRGSSLSGRWRGQGTGDGRCKLRIFCCRLSSLVLDSKMKTEELQIEEEVPEPKLQDLHNYVPWIGKVDYCNMVLFGKVDGYCLSRHFQCQGFDRLSPTRRWKIATPS